MIRINLLKEEGWGSKRRAALADIGVTQRVTVVCLAILLVSALVVGWQFYSVHRVTTQLDEQIFGIEQELVALVDVLERRDEFQARSAELARRVALVEELRAGQRGAVRMLDQVSRALPDGVWFTELRQEGEQVTILGRATGLTGLSDLVVGMENSGYFSLPVEIVDSQLDGRDGGELVRFELRGRFVVPTL